MAPRQKSKVRKTVILKPPPLPNWQALLTPVVANTFQDLGISVALWVTGVFWHPIHVIPNVIAFETENRVEDRRKPYNDSCFARVRREKKVVHGEFAGFHDVFAPIQDESGVRAIFVAGPIAIARPTSADLLQRWYALSGSQGRLGDPVFAQYISTTLATLTLEGPLFAAFERLMACFVGLVSGQGAPEVLAAESADLREKLLEARAAERHWETVRSMVNERTAHTWFAFDQSQPLARMGLNRVPEQVVVGLLLGSADAADPIDDVLRRNAFQRACVATARKLGDMLCGQVGDHGVVFLVDYVGSASSTRAKLTDLATRAAQTARRFGLRLHVGISQGADSGLPARYRAALAAAEMALSQGRSIVYGEPRSEHSMRDLRKLRAKLGESLGEHVNLLSPRFDRYVEAVLVNSGYRPEQVRSQLDAGLERMASRCSRPERWTKKASTPCAPPWTCGRKRENRHGSGGALPDLGFRHSRRDAEPDTQPPRSRHPSCARVHARARGRAFDPSASCARRGLCAGLLWQALQQERRSDLRALPTTTARRTRQTDARRHTAQHRRREPALWFQEPDVLSPRVQESGGNDADRVSGAGTVTPLRGGLSVITDRGRAPLAGPWWTASMLLPSGSRRKAA